MNWIENLKEKTMIDDTIRHGIYRNLNFNYYKDCSFEEGKNEQK